MKLDGWGISGMALDYAVVLFFVGSALLIFIYLWSKGRLDFDETLKCKCWRTTMAHEEIEEYGDKGIASKTRRFRFF